MMRLGGDRSHIIFSRYDSLLLLLYARARDGSADRKSALSGPVSLDPAILGIAGGIRTMTHDPSARGSPSSNVRVIGTLVRMRALRTAISSIRFGRSASTHLAKLLAYLL